MADRYSQYDRDRYERDRLERDRYDRDPFGRDERGFTERAGDEVRSWFGDEEAERRRRMDERERDRSIRDERWRGEQPAAGGWRGERAWGDERNYGSDRPYRDRDYGRNESYREYGDRYGRQYSAPTDYDRGSYAGSTYPSTSYPNYGNYAGWWGYSGSQEFGREGYAGQRYRREWGAERWRVPGPHVGRGPRGYQRSDERIREELNDRLTAHGLIDATDIQCQITNGEVTLDGFVDSREAKHAAEDVAEDIPGVREVHNRLRIRSHAPDIGVGRTNVLGLTEHDTQNPQTAQNITANENARQSRTRTS